jgi:hypothetical protein
LDTPPPYGPDAFDAASSFEIVFGRKPSAFTVAYGVSLGMTEERARAVDRRAFELIHGPFPLLSSPDGTSTDTESDDDVFEL